MEGLRNAGPGGAYVFRFCAKHIPPCQVLGSSFDSMWYRHHFEGEAKFDFGERYFLAWLRCEQLEVVEKMRALV